jgi:hypothetical protein
VIATKVYSLANGQVRYVTGDNAYDVAKALVKDAKGRLEAGDDLLLTVTRYYDSDRETWDSFQGTAAVSA